jgi:hypothetical protein
MNIKTQLLRRYKHKDTVAQEPTSELLEERHHDGHGQIWAVFPLEDVHEGALDSLIALYSPQTSS